jgi:hypothetical protein
VRLGFKLQIALVGILAVIVSQGTLYVDRMRVVTFDEIAVIAVHCPDEVRERLE